MMQKEDTTNEISLYTDEIPTSSEIATQVVKLKHCFPDVDEGFVIMLIDRISANRFTKQRLHDAIAHVVDTCHYQRPMIAEIVSFDRKVKTYTYTEMTAMCNQVRTSENFEMIELNGKKRWVER